MSRDEPFRKLPNPPPPGTVWAGIEAARKKLGWSARKLSTEAGFVGNNSARYSIIAGRKNWGKVASQTADKFVAALVKAGIEENDIRKPLAHAYGMPETQPLLARDSTRAAAAEMLVKRGYAINTALLWTNSIPIGAAPVDRIASVAEDAIKSAFKNGLLGNEQLPPSDGVVTAAGMTLVSEPEPARKAGRRKRAGE